MKPALLLVDLQSDFLDRDGLAPDRGKVVGGARELLEAFRRANFPVMHVRLSIRPDGSDRMPHWVENGIWSCVEGSLGASPPPELEALEGEPVFHKKFYSAFESVGLAAELESRGVTLLVIAGVYTHACVRATALDAYARGYEVMLAREAIASTEPLHAHVTLAYLERLAIRNHSTAQILGRLTGGAASGQGDAVWRLRNPARLSQILAEIPLSSGKDATGAVAAAIERQKPWSKLTSEARVERLFKWAGAIEKRRDDFIALLVQDIGKPRSYAEAEFAFALDLLRHAASAPERLSRADAGEGFVTEHAPLGLVAVITPWNNPLAIPLGKLAPALAWGNGAVWKPALPGSRVAQLLLQTLSGVAPDAPVSLLLGDDFCGQTLLAQTGVDAATFTGSSRQGRVVAAICSLHGKPLQAELGGNNAALVMDDADLDRVARLLAPAIFGFAGQRCTAPRRIIVQSRVRREFERLLLERIAEIPLGEPADPRVHVGPLVSADRQLEMKAALAGAEGAVLCGGRIPPDYEHGAWFEPTLIADPPLASRLFMEESFGPIAAIVSADDADHALQLNNAVSHGLVTTVFSDDHAVRRRLVSGAQSGLVVVNRSPAPIDAAAPFVGWKNSGLGPPEHGRWDLEFYTKPQAIYSL